MATEANRIEKATFAGGCFWCIESAFEGAEGVISATSGYTGGSEKTPSYEQVASGATGHLEAVEVTYDPEKISYVELLDIFWRQIDPSDPGGQFADRREGSSPTGASNTPRPSSYTTTCSAGWLNNRSKKSMTQVFSTKS
ncbi:MAG: peptide-methionine (S)-S-oxide reductase MsrA [Deltaproteobacteria bacterium]|nr:peptide-methionine (S)-S-oxide reductase MsrA [Deltaproteobacteria bacterium]